MSTSLVFGGRHTSFLCGSSRSISSSKCPSIYTMALFCTHNGKSAREKNMHFLDSIIYYYIRSFPTQTRVNLQDLLQAETLKRCKYIASVSTIKHFSSGRLTFNIQVIYYFSHNEYCSFYLQLQIQETVKSMAHLWATYNTFSLYCWMKSDNNHIFFSHCILIPIFIQRWNAVKKKKKCATILQTDDLKRFWKFNEPFPLTADHSAPSTERETNLIVALMRTANGKRIDHVVYKGYNCIILQLKDVRDKQTSHVNTTDWGIGGLGGGLPSSATPFNNVFQKQKFDTSWK